MIGISSQNSLPFFPAFLLFFPNFSISDDWISFSNPLVYGIGFLYVFLYSFVLFLSVSWFLFHSFVSLVTWFLFQNHSFVRFDSFFLVRFLYMSFIWFLSRYDSFTCPSFDLLSHSDSFYMAFISFPSQSDSFVLHWIPLSVCYSILFPVRFLYMSGIWFLS